jgi:SAM-dependent methyltransferase
MSHPIGERLSEQELCPDALLKGQEAAFARDIERLKAQRGRFVPVDCPACGGALRAPTFEKFTFTYVRCADCRTIYMSPRPSPEVMASYYDQSENYRYWAEHIFPASEASRREKIHRPWLARVLGYCERFGVPTGTLLEIGPGFGTWLELAKQSGRFARVVGVERTPEMAEACRRRGLEVVARPVEQAAGELPPADVAVAFELIEHLFDPRGFVGSLAGVLRPGGLLVLSCPNGEGFDIALMGPVSVAVDPEHVNLFNPASIGRLLQNRGFEILDVSTPGRLDAEFVHDAIRSGAYDVSAQPFLRRVLVEEWDRLGWPFQQFLAEQGLSSHMWVAARRRRD